MTLPVEQHIASTVVSNLEGPGNGPSRMENPTIPFLWLEIRRNGHKNTHELRPLRMEYVDSVDAADMLQFTLPDSGNEENRVFTAASKMTGVGYNRGVYEWIDNPLLIEDLKSEISIKFGYNDVTSDTYDLVFFRQRPRFSESGVQTTITAYDKGVYLMLPVGPKGLKLDRPMGIKDIIQLGLDEISERYDVKLEAVYDGHDWEGLFWSQLRPADSGDSSGSDSFFSRGGSTPKKREPNTVMKWLRFLASEVRVKSGGDKDRPDVYVHNGELHFHPQRKKWTPIAAFWFHHPQQGQRLISFEPEVNFRPGKVSAIEVDEDTGNIIGGDGSEETAGQTSKLADQSIAGDSGEIRPTSQIGEEAGTPTISERETKQYTVTGDEGDRILDLIVEDPRFEGTSKALIIEANAGIESEDNLDLASGDTVDVPVVKKADEPLTATELKDRAINEFLSNRNVAITAKARVFGNPRLRAGFPIDLFNVGMRWVGRWMIRECRHIIDESGYFCDLTLARGTVYQAEGLAEAAGTPPAELVSTEDATEQEDGNKFIEGVGGSIEDQAGG